jgi:hypothetical protein
LIDLLGVCDIASKAKRLAADALYLINHTVNAAPALTLVLWQYGMLVYYDNVGAFHGQAFGYRSSESPFTAGTRNQHYFVR